MTAEKTFVKLNGLINTVVESFWRTQPCLTCRSTHLPSEPTKDCIDDPRIFTQKELQFFINTYYKTITPAIQIAAAISWDRNILKRRQALYEAPIAEHELCVTCQTSLRLQTLQECTHCILEANLIDNLNDALSPNMVDTFTQEMFDGFYTEGEDNDECPSRSE